MFRKLSILILTVCICSPVFSDIDWTGEYVFGGAPGSVSVTPYGSSTSSSGASSSSSGGGLVTGAPNWGEWTDLPTVNKAGFTSIPATTGKVLYVSSAGNDSNSCTSTAAPCLTVGGAIQKMNGGDHIYLRRGDTFRHNPGSGQYNLILPGSTSQANAGRYLKSGISAANPTVVAFYGTGARPIIESDDPIVDTYMNGGVQHVMIIGIHFYAYKMDPANPEFGGGGTGDFASLQFYAGNNEGITLEDNIIEFIELGIQRNSANYADRAQKDFKIRRNIFKGIYWNGSCSGNAHRPSNIYQSRTHNLLIEENIFDYGGWNPDVNCASANQFNHNLYFAASDDPLFGNTTLVKGNVLARASSLGSHGRMGGRYENNHYTRGAIGLQLGYENGPPLSAGTRAQAIDNVISECLSMHSKGTPIASGNLPTGAKWGIVFENYGQGDYLVTGNVVQHGSLPGDWSGTSRQCILYRSGATLPSGSVVADNICYKWSTSTEGTSPAYVDPGRTLYGYIGGMLQAPTDFDGAMNLLKSRPLRGWDDRYTAAALNAWIRAGYEVAQ